MGETECESCGNTVGVDSVESFCFGCKKMICQTCVDVWGHIEGGSHGLGDSVAEIARLREALHESRKDAAAEYAKFALERERAEKAERGRAELIEWKRSIETNPSEAVGNARLTADYAVRKFNEARSGEGE